MNYSEDLMSKEDPGDTRAWTCPRCKSLDVVNTGNSGRYLCRNCGLVGDPVLKTQDEILKDRQS